MSNWELFMVGIKLMIFGMGVVYVFLVLMVYCMKLLQWALRPWAGRFETKKEQPAARGGRVPDELAAVAVAACAFRKSQMEKH